MQWYVEFRGTNVTDEIGTLVDADNADDAVVAARAKVRDDWNNVELHADDSVPPVYEFDGWKVNKCTPWMHG